MKVKLTQSSLQRGQMAQTGVQLDRETLSCSICLDLLKDPVTIPCGHSYCMSCIQTHWDEEGQRKIHSCPQCTQVFKRRPVLMKSTLLATLVEELKKIGLQDAAADYYYAGPEDVACDFCTGRKLKAVKSCLQCLASYCEKHLQTHFDITPLKKHKLVEPSENLQVYICSRHNEVMKMFCRTDGKCICYLCSVDEHKGHEMVSATAERTERQRELEVSRQKIQKKIYNIEINVKVLQQETAAIGCSADEAVKNSETMFTELTRVMEKRRRNVKQQIRSQQETEVSRVRELKEKLEQEITELRRKDAELEKLSHTEDHNQFLHNYPSLSKLREPTDSSSINMCPLLYFEDVTAAVSELRDKLQRTLSEEWTNISMMIAHLDVLLSQSEPKTRSGFLKYSCELTLDPNTANTWLSLSEGNKRATFMSQQQKYVHHPERFSYWSQVLSRECLTGRCYWEVKWSRRGVSITVAYKRKGSADEGGFGQSDKSWALYCDTSGFIFRYNGVRSPLSGPPSSRIGVYLDHRAGILSFYSVSEDMTLLHRVQSTFTQPLYAGFALGCAGATAQFSELK